MKTKHRFVFGTNVHASTALRSDSNPSRELVKLAEFYRLSRLRGIEGDPGPRKFYRYSNREDREQFLVAFLRVAIVIEITEPIVACHDPKTPSFLNWASAEAQREL